MSPKDSAEIAENIVLESGNYSIERIFLLILISLPDLRKRQPEACLPVSSADS